MAVVVALDLSSTRTGICANGECMSYTPPKERVTLLDKARATADHIVGWAITADLVVIEAIGTRMIQSAIALATVHAIVLDRLGSNTPVQMVTPAELKRFATGKGNASKDEVLLAAAKLEPTIANNDEADAWVLWAMGCYLTGTPFIETDYRWAVINKLKNGNNT